MKTLKFLIISFPLIYFFGSYNILAQDGKSYDQMKQEGKIIQPPQTTYKGEYPNINNAEISNKNRTGKNSNILNNSLLDEPDYCRIEEPDSSFIAFRRDDDASSIKINLPFSFTFYGNTFNAVFGNINGNISLDGPLSTFTSTGFPFQGFPMIAPFWADVDTRNSASGNVYYKLEDTRLTIVWDSVGYFNNKADKLNTFKLIISNGNDPLIGIGNNVAFIYGDMQWTTGDHTQSGGINGFGGVPATAGTNMGDGVKFFQIGRFNKPGIDYDGPGGNPDGVDYLDNKCYLFDLSSVNTPPIAQGFPGNNELYINVGETINLNISFISPENDQNTEITSTINTVPGFSTTSYTPGNPANMVMQFEGRNDNIGIHNIQFIAADNGIPIERTEINLKVTVASQCPQDPSFTSLPSSLCYNSDPINLTGNPVGGVFSGPGITNNRFFPRWAGIGNKTITYTVTKNNCIKTSKQTISVFAHLPTPQITGNGPYCENMPITITASSVDGASYHWTGPKGLTSTANNITIPKLSSANNGAYTVYAEAEGCKSVPVTVNVMVQKMLSVTEAHTNVSVAGVNDGSISVKVLDGSPLYHYKLNNDNYTVNNKFVKLPEGNHSVTVKYGAGCTYEIKDIIIKKAGDECIR